MIPPSLQSSKQETQLHGVADIGPRARAPKDARGRLRYRTAHGWQWNRPALVVLGVSVLLTALLLVLVVTGYAARVGFLLDFSTILVVLILLRLALGHTTVQ